MRWVPDRTGRFRWRPWYDVGEIDGLCEDHVRRFLRARHGVVAYPIATDDLMLLIEHDADDLDVYADLSDLGGMGAEVEGVTTFVWGRRPRVRVARALSLDSRREARLRTTLAHEFGHVLLHNVVGDRDDDRLPFVPADETGAVLTPCCTPATILGARQTDWMEWQAGYASGALLMPRTTLQDTVSPFLEGDEGDDGHAVMASERWRGRLVDRVMGRFLVSEAAAWVRLRQLGYLAGHYAPLCATRAEADARHDRA